MLLRSLAFLLFFPALLLGQDNHRKSTETLFKRHFNPTPLKAMDSYPSRYQLSGAELSSAKKDSADLFRGIALLKAGEANSALTHLRKAAENRKESVSNASEWYLALVYLKLGKNNHAAYLFHKVAETEVHPYQDEAEVVYQQLVKLR